MDDQLNPRQQNRPPIIGYQPSEIGRASSLVRGRARLRDLPGLQTSSPAFSCGDDPASSSSSASGGRVTSRIMSNVRRSLSYSAAAKKKEAGLADMGMQSTPEEILTPTQLHGRTRPYDYHPDRSSRATGPTIEQIAMGLHISRTPHLGPSRGFTSSHARSRHRDTPDMPCSVSPSPTRIRPSHHRRDSAPVLISTPPRSSPKIQKPNAPQSVPATPSDSNVSLSSLTTSTTPSTPRSAKSTGSSMAHFSTRLHMRMSKLLLPSRKNSTSSSLTATTFSDGDSATSELTPRKVVRFSALSEVGDRR